MFPCGVIQRIDFIYKGFIVTVVAAIMTGTAFMANLSKPSFFIPVVLCLWANSGLAQTLPVPSGIGQAMKETRMPRPISEPPHASAPVIEQPPEQPLAPSSGETLTVHAFAFEGAEFIAESDLQAALLRYKDRPLTMADIEEAAGQITALYRHRGYLLARAYLPRQDASGGTLLIQVVPGRFGQLTLQNNSLVRDDVIRRVFEPLKSAAAVSRESLERAMLIVGDMPGAPLPTLTLAPGQAAGSSDFDINVGQGKRLDAYLLADNQGSRYTGKNRLSVGLDVNSPFGIADKFGVNAMSTDNGGLLNGRVAYGFPIGNDGLRAELAASKTTYELGDDYTDLDATGESRTLEGTLSYALLRSRDQTLAVSLNATSKHMCDDIDAVDVRSPKKANVGTLTLQRDAWRRVFDLPSYTNISVSWSHGQVSISDPVQRALNRAGANTIGNYDRLNLDWQGSIDLLNGWNLNTTASAQKALHNKNLDTSEQLGIAGSNGVKVYREWVGGDNGYLLGADLRYALPMSAGFKHSIGPFGDVGRSYLQNSDYANSNSTRLADVGLAYEMRRHGVSARIQWLRAAGPAPRVSQGDGVTRVLAQIGVQY